MKVCAYSTCNENYVKNAVVSLLSIKKWNKQIDLFIISRQVSKKTKNFASRYGISVVEINLNQDFNQAFSYPIECYYVFVGPEHFLKKGYDYSIYVDGDIYCNSPISVKWEDIAYFAGVSIGKIEHLLGNDLDKIRQTWQFKHIPNHRVQTGVLFFNNRNLAEEKFLSKIVHLYKESLSNLIPRSGDDSLFSLFQILYPEIKPKLLEDKFNYIVTKARLNNQENNPNLEEKLINNCVFFSFYRIHK